MLLACGLMAQTTPDRGIVVKTPGLRAFTNARIVVSPEITIEKGILVIDRGKIINVGANINVPAGATDSACRKMSRSGQ